ncbi:hypothetical protein GQ457_09G020470 [Hibiscus cannabinus]
MLQLLLYKCFDNLIKQDDKGDISIETTGPAHADISVGLQISTERLAVAKEGPFITSSVVIATEENNHIIIKNNCEVEMGMPCVWEVFNSIFKTKSVTSKCCGELVALGKVCHSALVQRTLESPNFQNLDRDTIVQKTTPFLYLMASLSAYSLLVVLFITSSAVIATGE